MLIRSPPCFRSRPSNPPAKLRHLNAECLQLISNPAPDCWRPLHLDILLMCIVAISFSASFRLLSEWSRDNSKSGTSWSTIKWTSLSGRKIVLKSLSNDCESLNENRTFNVSDRRHLGSSYVQQNSTNDDILAVTFWGRQRQKTKRPSSDYEAADIRGYVMMKSNRTRLQLRMRQSQ